MRCSIFLLVTIAPMIGVGLEAIGLPGSPTYGQATSVSTGRLAGDQPPSQIEFNFRSEDGPSPGTAISNRLAQPPIRAVSAGVPVIVRDALARQDNGDGELSFQEDSFEKIWRRKSIHDTHVVIREMSEDAPNDRSGEIDYGTGDWMTFHPNPRAFFWEAPEIRYRPLYFEDVELERYGRTYSHPRQMLRSALHFAKSTAMLPHKMWHDHPFSCDWPLGFARPGICTPSIHQRHYYGRRSTNLMAGGLVEEFDYRFE